MSFDSTPTPMGFREVRPAGVASHLGGLRLVDVREPHEFAGGHIAGAELVPLATVLDAAAAWDPHQPTLLICRSGNRSGRAAVELARRGFTGLYNMAGGMLEWEALGLPMAR